MKEQILQAIAPICQERRRTRRILMTIAIAGALCASLGVIQQVVCKNDLGFLTFMIGFFATALAFCLIPSSPQKWGQEWSAALSEMVERPDAVACAIKLDEAANATFVELTVCEPCDCLGHTAVRQTVTKIPMKFVQQIQSNLLAAGITLGYTA